MFRTRRRTLGAALLLVPALAAAADHAGRYSATELVARWNVGDWGEACGPKPSGGSEPPATFRVETAGGELTFSGPRTYRTTSCWEVMPGLRVTSHSASRTAIRTTCAMPPGDPREATITTNWALRADKLYLDEVGQYRFLLGGETCTASVRRTRVWTRIDDTPTPGSPSAIAAVASVEERADTPRDAAARAEAAQTGCATPGPPVRLTARSQTRVAVAGQATSLRALLRDAAGCLVDVPVSYEVRAGKELIGSLVGGELMIAEQAPPGRIVVEARAAGYAIEFFVKVVSREEYAALLEGDAALLADDDLPVDERRSNVTVGTDSRNSETDASSPPLSKALPYAAGLVALATVAGAVALARRRRAARKPSTPTPSGPPATSETPTKICPVCGRRYDGAATFCGDDGALLLRSN